MLRNQRRCSTLKKSEKQKMKINFVYNVVVQKKKTLMEKQDLLKCTFNCSDFNKKKNLNKSWEFLFCEIRLKLEMEKKINKYLQIK